MFPSEQVELPSAEKFKAFPEEAQKAILRAFEREQLERHAWLKNQQAYDHQINLQSTGSFFVWRMTGTICGCILAIVAFGVGAYLVRIGSTTIGVASMLFASGSIIGTAIYGHKAASPKVEKEIEPAE